MNFDGIGSAGAITCQLDLPPMMLTADPKIQTPEDYLLRMPSESCLLVVWLSKSCHELLTLI